MLMNAKPRVVSHGFESFVPIFITDPSHPRLLEMTNNGINAWGAYGSGFQSQSDQRWNDHNDDFNNENLSLFTLAAQGNGFSEAPSYIQARAASNGKGLNMHTKEHRDLRTLKREAASYPSYEPSEAYMTGVENSMPLFNEGHDWIMDQGLLDYSYVQASSLSYQPHRSVEYRSFNSAPTSSADVSCLSVTGSPCGSDFDSDKTGSVYSSHTAVGSMLSDPMTRSFNSLAVQDNSVEAWWPDLVDTDNMNCMDSSMPFGYADGLPRQYNAWQSETTSMMQYAPLGTISPKALTLNVSATSLMPSSFRSSDTVSMDSSSPQPINTSQQPSAGASQESGNKSVPLSVRGRHRLPEQPTTRPDVPILPSNDSRISKGKKRSVATGAASELRCKDKANVMQDLHSSYNVSGAQRPVPKRIEPKPDTHESCHTWTVPADQADMSSSQERESKDEFLVKSKLAGMSYKDIRREGGFTEAESTLRGRFRTLTKDKEERVRRPTWKENDIRLLKKAVRKLSRGSDPSRFRIPWKQVADYIYSNGGSYHFGNATCRKKWDELQR